MTPADLEKAASGANGTLGYFVGNPAILRTFLQKYSKFLTEDGERRVEERELRL